jgi:hypothetical protein
VLDVAIERKVVQKSGSYFSFGDERLGQGRTNVKAFLVEHPDVTSAILDKIQQDVPDVVVPRRDADPDGPTTIRVAGDHALAAREAASAEKNGKAELVEQQAG